MSAFFCYTDFELCLLGRVPDFTRKGGAEGVRYRPIRRNSEYGRVYARGKSYVNPALCCTSSRPAAKRPVWA